jgi:hypothetical protein
MAPGKGCSKQAVGPEATPRVAQAAVERLEEGL